MHEQFRAPAGSTESAFPGGKSPKSKSSGGTAAAPAQADRPHIPTLATDLRVLVVEPNSIFALTAEDILLRSGAALVQVAATPAEALQYLELRQHDVALVDLKVGDRGARRVAARLWQLDIPFAFTTEFGATAAVPRAFADSMIIDKPYNALHLTSCLARLLGPR